MKSRILIADDAELNREMLSQMLGEQYDFVYACDGVEAVELLASGTPIDLVLLDVNMPEMDGFEVLRIMNERRWIEEFPVIIISAENGIDFITKAYQLGAVDYINRPFYAVVVQRRVENTLLMYSNQKRLIRLVGKQVYEREKVNNAMINIFSNIIEMRNHESGSHTLNVQTITDLLLHRLIGLTDRYGLTKADISLISSLSALHDIGKIKVPEDILNKAGKLTAEERALMQMHTIEGDRILSNPELDQSSLFVRTARDICRWHHEKYDGGGYPDGLVGDDIPISAQVVSMADVYDALTSERCYKQPFTHEKAMDMILGGECGAFNPLLLQCLTDISAPLKELTESSERYDYQSSAAYVADELLADDSLPQDNALRRMLDNERKKKDFFMDCSDGVLFEYDRPLHKVTFINQMADDAGKRRVVYTLRDGVDKIMSEQHWNAMLGKLQQTTPDASEITMDVALQLGGECRPYRAQAMAIWPERGTEYISVVGQLLPMREPLPEEQHPPEGELLSEGKELPLERSLPTEQPQPEGRPQPEGWPLPTERPQPNST